MTFRSFGTCTGRSPVMFRRFVGATLGPGLSRLGGGLRASPARSFVQRSSRPTNVTFPSTPPLSRTAFVPSLSRPAGLFPHRRGLSSTQKKKKKKKNDDESESEETTKEPVIATELSLHFDGKRYSPLPFPENFEDLKKQVSKNIEVDVGEFVLEITHKVHNKDFAFGNDYGYETAKTMGKTDRIGGLIVKASRKAAPILDLNTLLAKMNINTTKNLIPWLGDVSVREDVSPAFSKLLADVDSVLGNDVPENGKLLDQIGSFPFNPPKGERFLIRKAHLQVLEDLRLDSPSMRIVVTGCSGIGKSTTTILLVIRQLMLRRSTAATTSSTSSTSPTTSTVSGDTTRPLVILLSHSQLHYVFISHQSLRDAANPLGTRAYRVLFDNSINCPPIKDKSGNLVVEEWSLVDGRSNELNEDPLDWQDRHGILFASPVVTAKRTQTWKTSRPVVLPPWTIGELRSIFRPSQFDHTALRAAINGHIGEFGHDHRTATDSITAGDAIDTMYFYFGGIPCHFARVIENVQNFGKELGNIETAVKCAEFKKFLTFGNELPTHSDHLVYPVLANGIVENVLRSEYVCRVVYAYVNLFDPEARKQFFVEWAGRQGLAFEAYIHTVLRYRVLSFCPLKDHPRPTTLVRLGSTHEWYSAIPKEIRMDTVYWPISERNPMFDSFYVSEDPRHKRYHVVAIQVTLAGNHSVKPEGFPLLSSVVDGLTKKDYKVRFHLMFATPGIPASNLEVSNVSGQPSDQGEKFRVLNKPQTIDADPTSPIDPTTFCIAQWVLAIPVGAGSGDLAELNNVLADHGTDVAQADVMTPGPREAVENVIRRIQEDPEKRRAAVEAMTIEKMTAYLTALNKPAPPANAPKSSFVDSVMAALSKVSL